MSALIYDIGRHGDKLAAHTMPTLDSLSLSKAGAYLNHDYRVPSTKAFSDLESDCSVQPPTPFELWDKPMEHDLIDVNVLPESSIDYENFASILYEDLKPRMYSKSEWERIRPIFESLYLDSKLRLTDIMRTMSLEHNFHATEQMYKKRITKWGIFRSMKAAQKDAMIRDIVKKSVTEITKQSSQNDKLHKLLRHALATQKQTGASPMNDRLLAELRAVLRCSAKETQVKGSRTRPGDFRTYQSVVNSRNMACTPLVTFNMGATPMEHLLHAGRASVSFLVSVQQHRMMNNVSCVYKSPKRIRDGRAWLRVKAFARARKAFDELRQALEEDLKNLTPQFISRLLSSLTRSDWDTFMELRDGLAHHVVVILKETLGEHHALTTFMRIFATIYHSYDDEVTLYQCLISHIESSSPNVMESGIEDFSLELVWSLERCGRQDEAIQLCKRNQNLYKFNIRTQLNMELDIPINLVDKGLLIQGNVAFEEAHQLACKSGNSSRQLATAWNLAKIYQIYFLEYELAEHWYRIALDSSLDHCQLVPERMVIFRRVLKGFEKSAHNAHRRAAFLADYADVYEQFLEITDDPERWTYEQAATV